MGFQSPQFDFIDQRFSPRHMKTLEVLCSKHVQATSSDPQEIDISGTYNGTPAFSPATGQLLPGNRIVVSDIDPGATVIPNKVCNIFLVTWSIVDSTGDVLEGPFTTTVADAVKCPGAGLGPNQTVIQKHDIQVMFCTTPVDTDDDGAFDVVYVTLDVEYCLVVAQEVVLKVNVAQPFCP
ncbi:MAG TPA: hypothetical protein GXZ82_06570 [Firmicutes bacterium]|nr:hypothetical protein [Bacillota bacterium]